MSVNAITSTGITIQQYSDLITYYTAQYQTIYGAGVNLDQNSPDGQMMNIQIQTVLDLLDFAVQVFNSFDPDLAYGVVLDLRVAINGLIRKGGTYTVTPIAITVSQALTLQGLDLYPSSPYTVQDNAGNNWQLLTTQSVPGAGTYSYQFQAANIGAVLSLPNTITIPVSIVLGVTSINNPTSYTTLGLNQETDAVLKIRRQQSVALPSQGFNPSLEAALENINGVVSALVHENDGGSTDIYGVPGHTIWPIVDGMPTIPVETPWSAVTTYSYGNLASSAGVDYKSIQNNNTGNAVSDTAYWSVYNPIAEAIYTKRSGGSGMYGSQSYNYVQSDGTTLVVRWDFVEAENVFVKFTLTSIDGVNPPNESAILTNLPLIFVPGVFKEININTLATYIQQIDPNALVTNAGFSATAGGSYTPTFTPSNINMQLVISEANIIALPIVLNSPTSITTVVMGTVTVNVSVAPLGTIQFTPIGGYPTYTWAVTAGTGSINGSGLFTAPAGAETDTVQVTDSLGNMAVATVTVT